MIYKPDPLMKYTNIKDITSIFVDRAYSNKK